MRGARESARERAIKEALLEQLISSGLVDPAEVAEWLWEDFGIRVKPDWPSIRRAILRAKEVTIQDLASAMIEWGVMPDEGIWFSEPVYGMQVGRDSDEGE